MKKAILITFDALSVCACACVLLAFTPVPAHAYVDPSVMTYTIQALAGVAVALSAVLGVALRRVRKKILKALNIDENARKIVEPTVHRVDPVTREPIEEFTGSHFRKPAVDEGAVAEKAKADKGPTWPMRLVVSLVVSLFAVLTVFVLPSLETIGGNAASLTFGLADVMPLIATTGAIATVVIALVMSIPHGKGFALLSALVFGVGLCAYLQAMFMNAGIPSADGTTVAWENFKGIAWLSLTAWIAVLVVACVANVKRQKVAQAVMVFVGGALIIMQFAGAVSLWTNPSTNVDKTVKLTTDGINTVSSKGNVVVFVLDTLDTKFALQTRNEFPNVYDNLTGFTFYDNTAGGFIPTRYGVPFLLTGQFPKEGETVTEYRARRFGDSTLIQDISQTGHSVGIYTDTFEAPLANYTDEVMNFHTTSIPLNVTGSLEALVKCSMYRGLPWVCKPFVRYTTDELNNKMPQNTGNNDEDLYAMDDVKLYNTLKASGLTVSDEGSNGAFRFIHLLGAHVPLTVDENCSYVPTGTTVTQQTAGTFKLIDEYIAELKRLGVYDETSIIITADHGEWLFAPAPVPEPTCPLVMYKPAHQGAAQNNPMVVSNVPIDHEDVIATYAKDAGVNTTAFGPTVTEVPDAPRMRYFYWCPHDTYIQKDYGFWKYAINGNANDFANWSDTGQHWPQE